METQIPPYASLFCVKSFTVIVGCITIVSHNVAITTSYADGELFVIENEPPDTRRKGSQNEPRTFEKVLCGGRAALKTSLRPAPSLFFSRQSLLPQNSLVKIPVVLIPSFLITTMAEWSHSPRLLWKGTRKGNERVQESWFQIQRGVITDPQQGSSTCSFVSL